VLQYQNQIFSPTKHSLRNATHNKKKTLVGFIWLIIRFY